jgi:hypothetical protein
MTDIKLILPDFDDEDDKESPLVKKGIGFGNRYGTLNPFVILARKIAKKYSNSKNAPYDYFITSWAAFGSSRAHLLGYPIYGNKSNKFIDKLYKILYQIYSFKTDLNYRLFKRQHKLTIKNIAAHTWTDVDDRMFHAMFTLLGDFVEKELGSFKMHPGFDFKRNYRGYNLHSQDHAAIDLWLWYKYELPKECDAYNDYIVRKYENHPLRYEKSDIDGFNRIVVDKRPKTSEDEKYHYRYIEDLKDKKFAELCEIRKHLWI